MSVSVLPGKDVFYHLLAGPGTALDQFIDCFLQMIIIGLRWRMFDLESIMEIGQRLLYYALSILPNIIKGRLIISKVHCFFQSPLLKTFGNVYVIYSKPWWNSSKSMSANENNTILLFLLEQQILLYINIFTVNTFFSLKKHYQLQKFHLLVIYWYKQIFNIRYIL